MSFLLMEEGGDYNWIFPLLIIIIIRGKRLTKSAFSVTNCLRILQLNVPTQSTQNKYYLQNIKIQFLAQKLLFTQQQ